MRKILFVGFISLFLSLSSGCVTCQKPILEVCFSPNYCSNYLIEDIDRAKVKIDCMIYAFTSENIMKALDRAKSRGVTIRIIADKLQSTGRYSVINKLQEKGYKVKIMRGESGGIMHNKVMIIDNVVLFTGSYNYSKGAENRNYENLLRIIKSDIIKRYSEEFKKIWNSKKGVGNE